MSEVQVEIIGYEVDREDPEFEIDFRTELIAPSNDLVSESNQRTLARFALEEVVVIEFKDAEVVAVNGSEHKLIDPDERFVLNTFFHNWGKRLSERRLIAGPSYDPYHENQKQRQQALMQTISSLNAMAPSNIIEAAETKSNHQYWLAANVHYGQVSVEEQRKALAAAVTANATQDLQKMLLEVLARYSPDSMYTRTYLAIFDLRSSMVPPANKLDAVQMKRACSEIAGSGKLEVYPEAMIRYQDYMVLLSQLAGSDPVIRRTTNGMRIKEPLLLANGGISSLMNATLRRDMWIDEAACRNTTVDTFMPLTDMSGAGHNRVIAKSKKIIEEWCKNCPVQTDCLEYGKHLARSRQIKGDIFIYGGKVFGLTRGQEVSFMRNKASDLIGNPRDS